MTGIEGIKRIIGAVMLWTISLAMELVYVFSPDWRRGIGSLGTVIGLGAVCLTMSLVHERQLRAHRVRVSEILLLTEAERAREVSRIH